jgi:hypothetical protein
VFFCPRHFSETNKGVAKGMKIGTFAIAAGAAALGLAMWVIPGKAQGPLWDVVHVNLPYTVTVGDHTLQPGDYTIQQLRDEGGNSRVLLVYSENGMKFETSAMTIPTLDPNTARDTKVVLHHIGPDYYFDKIWIQGKDYGYEFPLPATVKAREREQLAAVSVPASYSAANQNNNTETTTAATAQETTSTSNQATAAATEPTTTAQATPPATASPSTVQPENSTANREMPEPAPEATTAATARHTMPSTSAGWLMMLLGGGALSGAGLKLRRKQ